MFLGLTPRLTHPDLFLAAAAAIPVLWVSIGFGGNSITTMFQTFNKIKVPVNVIIPIIFEAVGTIIVSDLGATLKVPFLGNKEIQLVSVKGQELVVSPMTGMFILAVLITGAAGEFLSLLAFYLPSISGDVAGWVFGLTSALVFLTMIALAFSLTASATTMESQGS
jgi:hypothetical protein